jgi:galactokinase
LVAGNYSTRQQECTTACLELFNKEGIMGYTQVALEDKILEMYPEITKHGISVSLNFDETKNAYIVKFEKDKHELTTHLEKKDADDCMNNVKCVYLGVQVEQFIKNFLSA